MDDLDTPSPHLSSHRPRRTQLAWLHIIVMRIEYGHHLGSTAGFSFVPPSYLTYIAYIGERPIVFRHTEPKLDCPGVGQVGAGSACGITQADSAPCERQGDGPPSILEARPCRSAVLEKGQLGIPPIVAKGVQKRREQHDHDHGIGTSFSSPSPTSDVESIRVGSQSASRSRRFP